MTNETKVRPEEELVEMWETVVGQDKTANAGDIGKTILPQSSVETFRRQHTLGALPRISPGEDLAEFQVTRTIGQGGMGLVRLARQASLYRDVAIKTILPEQMSEGATYDLLRESWVTGMLEHPNIVPIHALGVDEHGAPMLVMKRIEGNSWESVLSGQKPLQAAFEGGRDRLEDHLQILLQVCNAVQFAHSKGIIHCDLKPENIMLGEYGEVYLLDWGIAVSLVDDGTGRLPLANKVDSVRGTPSYIAPELATGEGSRIDRWTDVYLLGAITHEIVTGEPRHTGGSVTATLINAYRSAPTDYADSVPEELAAICNRATHPDPEQRFVDVDGFRKAIVDFLHHRDSLRLSEEAAHRFDALEDAIARARQHDQDEDAAQDAYRLFAECRFGFEQALEIWEQNVQARRGLEHALKAMIDFELQQRNDRQASLLIDELAGQGLGANDEFELRLADLRKDLAREAEEIEHNRRISHSVDIELASRERSMMCVLLGFLFGGVPFINHWLLSKGWATLTFEDYFIQFGVILVGAALVVGYFRERLFTNKINIRVIVSVFAILGGCLIMRLLGYTLGLEPAGCIALENGLLAFSMAMMAITIDWRMWPATLAFLGGAFGGGYDPEHILLYDGASNAAALWLLAFAWRERSDT
jgi:serine/threonine-protein kinase